MYLDFDSLKLKVQTNLRLVYNLYESVFLLFAYGSNDFVQCLVVEGDLRSGPSGSSGSGFVFVGWVITHFSRQRVNVAVVSTECIVCDCKSEIGFFFASR